MIVCLPSLGRGARDFDGLSSRLVAVKDANGHITRFEYDALGRQTRIVSPSGLETRFDYDAAGNRTHVLAANAVADAGHPRNAEGASVFIEYDEFGRVVRERDALNGETRDDYDLLGHVTAITDAEGQVTRFVHDDLGRLIRTEDPIIETPVNKTDRVTLYDEAGNPLVTEDRCGRIGGRVAQLCAR